MGAGFTVRNSGAYGIIRQNSSSFTSQVDSKGRALLSADVRKLLGLKFGSQIVIRVNGSRFETKVDERGRFGIPAAVRGAAQGISGEVVRAGRGGEE